VNVVWFKRDLRLEGHEALVEAANHGPVLPLYIIEPELWKRNDLSHRQYIFLCDCLHELNQSLEAIGQGLIIKLGDAVQVLQDIHTRHTIKALWSHQETWNGWTYERDKLVRSWAKKNVIEYFEPAQNGVIRGLKDRNGWASKWYRQMKRPLHDAPKKLQSINQISDKLPSINDLGLQKDGCLTPQKGGRSEGLRLLQSFLKERGESYTKEMSSPVTAYSSCARLSAHLAFGTLSIQEVFQATESRNKEIRQMIRGTKGNWPSALRSFSGRLRWHCHFIQKLEDEPRIEFENMHSAYNGIRENDFNNVYFEAWKTGRTGYPMVDACMRALIATGWLNFRMRAMLMSFASYHLWLHWRAPALHLAKLFTDYEPGIHYSQTQMQSGTTGINSIRIYNPIKQGTDHDPEGKFIRQWIPELINMTQEFIHTPWKASLYMNSYPMPIVNEKIARKAAADILYGLRKHKSHKENAQKIFKKHGSRKSGLPKKVVRKKTKNIIQGEFLI
jgi:deoxyribodipyrimidine photo-lyase|tara:strand:- start:1055 stop:2560 length:1506 start_codon:yes stop_codon:yes gene_type:complete